MVNNDYVCADCGHEQANMFAPCEKCGSLRVVMIEVAKELFGKNWRDCFKESGINEKDL